MHVSWPQHIIPTDTLPCAPWLRRYATVHTHARTGKLELGGRALSFDVDLSTSPCGCNAALYLVSMPQSDAPSECFDFYCDVQSPLA